MNETTGYILDFVIPQGPTGPTGPQGIEGATGPQGIQGVTGPAPTLEIGTITTGDPGSQASVTITPISN